MHRACSLSDGLDFCQKSQITTTDFYNDFLWYGKTTIYGCIRCGYQYKMSSVNFFFLNTKSEITTPIISTNWEREHSCVTAYVNSLLEMFFFFSFLFFSWNVHSQYIILFVFWYATSEWHDINKHACLGKIMMGLYKYFNFIKTRHTFFDSYSPVRPLYILWNPNFIICVEDLSFDSNSNQYASQP